MSKSIQGDFQICISVPLKKENYLISAFVRTLFSTKKSPKVVNLSLTDETLFEFLTSQTGQMAFPIFKVIMR